jgi:hypothetical protein
MSGSQKKRIERLESHTVPSQRCQDVAQDGDELSPVDLSLIKLGLMTVEDVRLSKADFDARQTVERMYEASKPSAVRLASRKSKRNCRHENIEH